MEQLAKDLAEFIRKEFLHERPDSELRPDTSLIETGIVDSLGIFTLIGFLEERLGIEIQPEDVLFENFETMTAILRLVSPDSR